MQLIEQSAQFIENGFNTDQEAMLKTIEMVGRTCYKSEDKITADSAERFVRMLIKRGHEAMLEHTRIGFAVFDNDYYWFQANSHLTAAKFIHTSICSRATFFSANVRAWREYLRATEDNKLYTYLVDQYPVLFEDLDLGKSNPHPGMRSYPVTYVLPGEEHDPRDVAKYRHHQHMTMKFVTNRGVTHEIVRHRPASYGQESTRYVNYGGSDMQFIKPVWWVDNSGNRAERLFLEQLDEAEIVYDALIGEGWKPEQAREVLPNALKTEIVMTATIEEWRHFFNLRAVGTSGRPHPQMFDLATKSLKIANRLHPGSFGDIVAAYNDKYDVDLENQEL